MDALILFMTDYAPFEHSEVARALKAIPGTYRHREGGDIASTYECFFDHGGDSTIVRLSQDRDAIEVTGTGDAAVRIVFELKERISAPMHVVDAGDSFELDLAQISSEEELRRAIAGSND